MTKKRRVEIHIEHSEISVFASSGSLAGQAADLRPDLRREDAAGLLHVRRADCPTCGSPSLVLLTEAVSHARLDLAALNQGMQDGSVHYHRSPSGEWWICTKSFQQS